MELALPKTVKKVQSLNGKVAALIRFVSIVTDKCLPFFRTLRKSFEWTTECQQVVENLKAYLSSPPLLSPSKTREKLFLYVVVSPTTVSVALVREEDGVQKPVYFTSRALRGVEERYPQMEKLTFALVTVARMLKPYFQAHTMIVLIDKPLCRDMCCPEAVGRMALWVVELSEFHIQYRLCTAMKGQVVSDFIVEFILVEGQRAEEIPQWSIHTDGWPNKQLGGVGMVLHSPEGDKIECMVHLDFLMTNNEVKYEALIVGLDLAKAAGVENLVVYCDFQVVTSQVNGDYECKNERMKKYLKQVKDRIKSLRVKFVQIPREENEHADRLAKAASAKHMLIPNQVLSFVQISSLIDDISAQEIGPKNYWTTPIASYLRDGVLLDDKEAARKLKVQAARFILIKDILYRRDFSRPYLRCLVPKEADYVMREVQEEVCGNHSRS
ncbi:uncharacterized protein LOC126704009 [Quercus robur]|uniref:uncharacterized protein LOC126704009 n=1 Tax=Quercus robur TaxID=38942 RepID=UPI00216372D7|nr:uncharacterized protein LOC126704009 [Quercus robur]